MDIQRAHFSPRSGIGRVDVPHRTGPELINSVPITKTLTAWERNEFARRVITNRAVASDVSVTIRPVQGALNTPDINLAVGNGCRGRIIVYVIRIMAAGHFRPVAETIAVGI